MLEAPSSTRQGSHEGSRDRPADGARIEGWVERARRRLGLGAGLTASCHAGLWLFPLLALLRFGLLRTSSPLAEPTWILVLAGLGLVASFGLGYLSRPSSLAAAVEFDQRLGARGAVVAAFELGGQGAHGGYLDLLRRGAELQLSQVRLSRVLPFSRPRMLGPLSVAFVAFLAALAIRPSDAARPPARPSESGKIAPAPAPLLPPEELALLAERAARLLRNAESDAGRNRALEYAALVKRLEQGQIDRHVALSAIAALEQEVSETPTRPRDAAENERAGAQGRPAERSPEANQHEQQKDAAEALRRLAERLAQETVVPSAAELDRIRETLKQTRETARRSREAAAKQTDQRAERLRDKERRLLDKQKQGELSREEAAELEQTQRQLETLERQKRQQAEAGSALDQELSEALRELGGQNARQASEFVERAAEQLGDEAKRALTDQEKRELLEQLRALKERLRQGEQGDVAEKLRQFERRAQGKSGKQGEGQEGEPGRSGLQMVPRNVSGPGQTAPGQSGQPGSGQPSSASQSGSSEAGTEHDPNWQGPASKGLEAGSEDRLAAARDTGQGRSDSETILSAAEEGFTAAAYERLYKDYETVLEEMVRGEAVPQDRRTEVERYFDLIRPRDN